MTLSEEQRQAVRGWVEGGCSLSEVQRKLSEEYDVSMTYMDVRFLVLELNVDLQEQAGGYADTVAAAAGSDDAVPAGMPSDPAGDLGGLGGVSVEVDRVVKPGSLVSGTVVFSDGTRAAWGLDQLGRLALQADTPGYNPSPEDLQAFQEELRNALSERGF